MATYGMSAKDRLALFQGKSGSDDAKKAGPKKIGKLNIGGPAAKKEPVKKPAPKKLAAKKTSPPKDKAKPAEKKGETKVEPKKEVKTDEPPREEKKTMPKKEEAKAVAKDVDTDLDLDSELEANINMVSDVESDVSIKREVMAKNAEEAKPAPSQEEAPKPKEMDKNEAPMTEKQPAENTTPEVKQAEVKKDEVKKQEVKKEEHVKVEQKEVAAKKPEPQKVEAKQLEPQKIEAKKPEPKKIEAKKPEPKKIEAKKPEPKKIEAEKPEPKKIDAKKPEPKKIEAKKPEPKKIEAKKLEPKKMEAKKPEPKKVEAKKPEPKKMEAKKSEPKNEEAPVIVEDVIEEVVVERKAQPCKPDIAAVEERLLEVSAAVITSAPQAVKEQKGPVVKAQIVEEVIEAVPATKEQTAPPNAAPTPSGPAVCPPKPAPPPQPKPEVKIIKPMQKFKPSGDDFYNTIFYFSGMGTVVGSSLSRGIYVPDRLAKTSLDADVIDQLESYKPVAQKRRDTIVESARNQATDLTDELKKLRALLFGLPSWGETTNEGQLDPISVQRIGGAAPQPMAQPVGMPALELITQASAAMAQSLPPQKPAAPAAPRPATRRPQPPQLPVADPLALASTAKEAANKRLQEQPQSFAPPPAGGVNMYGVYAGDLKTAGGANKPWQERYGKKPSPGSSTPRPHQLGGELESQGLKPWQASRLRGLEARGYEFKRPPTKTGADYGGDAFCGSKETIEIMKEDDIGSYTPYLVSGKTKAVDMRKLLSEQGYDVHATGYNQGQQRLPYCDL